MSSRETSNVDLDQAVTVLKALANPTRLRIALEVAKGECSVGDLEERLGIQQPGLSQQLAVLRNAGFLTTRKQARHVYYLVNHDNAAGQVRALLKDLSTEARAVSSSKASRPSLNDAYAAKFATILKSGEDPSDR